MPHTLHLRGLFLTITGVLVLTPDSLLIRLIQADHYTLIFYRGLFLALSMSIYLIFRYRGNTIQMVRDTGKRGLVCGILFSGSAICFVSSITMTTAANTLVILSMAPLFSAVLSYFFLSETAPMRTWMAMACCIVGIGLIFSGDLDPGKFWGNALALGASLCLGSYFVVIRHSRSLNMVPGLVVSGVILSVVMLPFASPFAINTQDLLLLIGLGGGILPISFGLLTLGPRYLPAPEVGLIMLLETVLGPVWVWWGVGEVPGLNTLWGGLLVIGTLVIHLLVGLRKSIKRS